MLKNLLTCEKYLKHYNEGDKTVVAQLDGPEHIHVMEQDDTENYWCDDNIIRRISFPQHRYLVGPIANALHAYEELGYSPEELKKIIEEHKRYKERSLYISSAINMTYGSLGSPFRKKLEEMREAAERRKRMEDMLKEINVPSIESLYPQSMLIGSAREMFEKAQNEMRTIAHIDEWAKAQITHAKTKPKHPIVERAIFNDPATIVFWKDGTKTVVKAQKGEKYDPEKGLAMAFSKKMFGNEGNYYDQFAKLLPKKNDKK